MGGLSVASDLLAWLWRFLSDPAIGHGVAIAVGAVFVTAGVHKLRRPDPAATAIRQFGLPRLAGSKVARLLGVLEATAGIAIVVPWTARLGAVACAVLAAVFVALTARAYGRGDRFACGCLSASSEPLSRLTVARAAALLAAAAMVAALPAHTAVPTVPVVLAAGALATALIGGPMAVVTLHRCRRLTSRYVERVRWEGLAINWANNKGGAR